MATISLIDDFYCCLPREHLGSSDWGSSDANDYQKHNAEKIYDYLSAKGFTINAISGILGCMQTESYLSPTCLESGTWSYIPENSELTTYQKGIGLVQWTSSSASTTSPQKLIAFCDRYGLTWYYGSAQLFRIFREYETDIQFNNWTVDGKKWTWEVFKTSTDDPTVTAKAWDYCYEVSSHTALAARQRNATAWYNYLKTYHKIPIWLLFKMKQNNFKR